MRGGGMVVAPEGGLGPSLLPRLWSSVAAAIPRLPPLSAHLKVRDRRPGCERTSGGSGGLDPRHEAPSPDAAGWPLASPRPAARSGPQTGVFIQTSR